MIDIKNIQNSPVIKTPWQHKIIDNFFPQEVFNRIRKAAEHLSQYTVEKKTLPLWLYEAVDLGMDKQVETDIISAADDILDNLDIITSDFDNVNKSNLGHYAMPKFGVSGKNFTYPIHPESVHKVLVFVIYIFPDEDHGTRLYREKNEESFSKEIEWKPNRAFLTCPGNNDVTWHNWSSTVNTSRITLNIFCEQLEAITTSMLHSGKNEDPLGILWLYDKFNNNKLTTNKF